MLLCSTKPTRLAPHRSPSKNNSRSFHILLIPNYFKQNRVSCTLTRVCPFKHDVTLNPQTRFFKCRIFNFTRYITTVLTLILILLFPVGL